MEDVKLKDLSLSDLRSVFENRILKKYVHPSEYPVIEDGIDLESLQSLVRETIKKILSYTLFLGDPLGFTYTECFE